MTGNNVTYSLNAMGNAIGYSDTLLAKADTLFGQSLEQVNSRALNDNDIDCILGNGFAKEEFGHPIDGIPCQMQAGVDFISFTTRSRIWSTRCWTIPITDRRGRCISTTLTTWAVRAG